MAIASSAAALGVSVGTLYVAAGIMVVVVNYATGGVVSLTITGMLIAFAQTAIEIRKATVAALTNELVGTADTNGPNLSLQKLSRNAANKAAQKNGDSNVEALKKILCSILELTLISSLSLYSRLLTM